MQPVVRNRVIRAEAVGVKPSERVPDPHRLEVLIEDDHFGTDELGGSPPELDSLRRDREDHRIAVGQELGLMVEVDDLRLTHRGQPGVDGVDISLAQRVARQVNLPQRVKATGNTDGIPALPVAV